METLYFETTTFHGVDMHRVITETTEGPRRLTLKPGNRDPLAPWNLGIEVPGNTIDGWKSIRCTRFDDLETALLWIEHTYGVTPVLS